MPDHWLGTGSDDDARKRVGEFWQGLSADLDAGQFWADRIRQYQGEPAKRLALAMENLPLPAAFSEAAIAVRALIRNKRKLGQPYGEELNLLYWLAALRSFMLDYAARLQEPGFNVMQAIPGNRLQALRYTYAELGYRELFLLGKMDVKWITDAWGEPRSHSTLNALHRDLWDEYETKLMKDRERSRQSFQDEIAKLLTPTRQVPAEKPNSRTPGCTVVIAGTLAANALQAAWLISG